MNDDELRDQLGRLDPLAESELNGDSITPYSSPQARELLENIMATPQSTKEKTEAQSTPQPSSQSRMPALAGAAAMFVVAAIAGFIFFGGSNADSEVAQPGDPDEEQVEEGQPGEGDGSVLNLTAVEEDLFASCMRVEPTIIAQSQIAFRGTVVSAEAGVVELTVDDAYVGIDAESVILSAPEGLEALIGGVAWEVGEAYLVSASSGPGVPSELGGTPTEGSGTVNYCGQTGPATGELQALYDEAFAS